MHYDYIPKKLYMARVMTSFLCIIFGFCCAAIFPSTCLSNGNDVHALLAFKGAIVDQLGALNSWNKTQHYCTWNGISCGFKHPDRVVKIRLRSLGLVGSLSSHIGNLSFLRIIDLKNNSFHGRIPQEIGRLRRLEGVEFSNNFFSGEIPINISQCPNLVYLNLISNHLSGLIPTDVISLNKLEHLGLAFNNLSGSIPPVLGNLTSLVQLSLISCGLKGRIPQSLTQLRNLQYFRLSDNSLIGNVPYGLFNISTIIRFAVSGNQLQGVIPDNIGHTLPHITGLYLGNNQFTGELPTSLSNATSLEVVSLYSNTFKGTMPKELGKLSKLKHFSVSDNLIQDDISFITSFTNCTYLTTLGLGSNLLSGSLPESISNLSSQIQGIEISRSQVHGNIPSAIGNLIGLTILVLYYNDLEGPIPFNIGKLSNLGDLYLEGNRFTDEIPDSFRNFTMLYHLSLQENSLSGSIPQSLGNCTRLLYLDMASNILDGSIPPQIMKLSSISLYLSLSNNRLTGSIPLEVGALTHLAALNLSNNRLSGPIPISLSGCTSMERLHLEDNLLQGEIPSTLSVLKGLQVMDISRNNLSGKIPIFFSHLSLKNLNLSFNRFNGEVPVQGIFGNKTAFSIEGNIELCGGIPDLKLPLCSSSKSSKKHLPALLKIFIPILVVGGLLMTFGVCIFRYIYLRNFLMKNKSSKGSFDGAQFMRLSYGDLLKATNGFSEDNLIGAGRFGSVFKGTLDDGKLMIAVKVLNLFVKGASKSFIAECIALKGLRHRNLLKLLSVCESIDFHRNEFKALVYEFMSNGSLEDLLYSNREQEKEEDTEFRSFDMLQRLKIAIDVAHALEYLHIGTDSPVIHGDLKPSNVLLDDNMTSHVGDFGLSKVVFTMLEAPESSSTIGIKGTIGYIPPEYGTSNSISMEGDVYSFGILLLEMFTGKRPTDQAFGENLNLHDFVIGALPNHVVEIVDPLILEGHYINNKMLEECVASILSIGVACSMKQPIHRMCITNVVNGLCKIRDNYMAGDLN